MKDELEKLSKRALEHFKQVTLCHTQLLFLVLCTCASFRCLSYLHIDIDEVTKPFQAVWGLVQS